MKAIDLRVEYLNNPIGIDITKPRFFWKCQEGINQTAYQIVAMKNEKIAWDSGKVFSSSSTHIEYEGKQLISRDRVDWKVRLWDEKGESGEYSSAWFEMGLLDEDDWVGKWICGNYTPIKNKRYPVDYFKRNFAIEKKITKARLYISSLGIYEAHINNKRVGDYRLAPGVTDYRKRVQYQTYDITEFLEKENTLEVKLADGWYRGSIGCWGKTNVFGRQTKVICQVEIIFFDGSTRIISSGDDFSWSNDGPITFSDLKDGEIVDGRKVPSYKGKAIVCHEERNLTASNNEYPKQMEVFVAKESRIRNNKLILDFGQNIAGFISFKIKGEKGEKIKIKCGERLDENGELNKETKHIKPIKEFGKVTELLLMFGKENAVLGKTQPTPLQEIEYTCNGDFDEYKMEFSIFGFQYAEIETNISVNPSDFKAHAVYTSLEETSKFECSDVKINKLVNNSLWSMKGNFLDIPTDCPTRERLAWTGDGQLFFETASIFMNVAPFYRKWLNDFKDGQFKNGKISAVVPYAGMSMLYDNTGSSSGWGDAIILIPYKFWKTYNDQRIIEDYYEMMKKYALFVISNTGHKSNKVAKKNPYNKYTYEKGVHLGEWLEPDSHEKNSKDIIKQNHTETSTAYFSYTMNCISEIALELNKHTDYLLFSEYSKGARKAYNYLFVKNSKINSKKQASFVRPLSFNLLEKDARNNAINDLVDNIESNSYAIGTGFLSTPILLPVLSENGESKTAFKVLMNESYPSWLYQVNNHSTTMWEHWDGSESRNHYIHGSVSMWIFMYLLGIKTIGERKFSIKPEVNEYLKNASGSINSIFGCVRSSWELKDGLIHYEFDIPTNCSAEIILPKRKKITVGPGIYHISVKQ